MSSIKWLDNLKLRVGYGETSNQSVDPYKTLGRLSTRTYNFGTQNTTGYYVSELPNTELGWEYSTTWNFGIDFSLFQGRLSGTMEYYIQNTKDLADERQPGPVRRVCPAIWPTWVRPATRALSSL